MVSLESVYAIDSLHFYSFILKAIAMKPHFNFLSTAFFPKRLLIYPVIVMIGISQSSCFRHFYQSNTTHVVNADTLERLQAGKNILLSTVRDLYLN